MKAGVSIINDEQVLLFKNRQGWASWLQKNHLRSSGVWLRLAKKGANVQSVSYDEALEEGLRYGWIDGQKRSYDETSWLQRFAPRGARSIWSKKNRDKAEELIKRGQMKPAGKRAVESAKRDGRWDRAYDSPSEAKVPKDFQLELDSNARAKAFFATLNSINRYSILHRIQTAKKAETRRKRIRKFVGMLTRKEKIHP